ncbi:putative HTH-type transcriptional regulator yvdT [Blastochloris viridis]|uniref:Putative HTH-type transcriptional regulator yvdT n=1 Tax=Blastochloris viridis TaxID=1079 RepID=A0A0S4Q2N5_BLAVI|nr:putative HTH-type transcriptional regulator yvdT [Blastochloris viridis]
MRTEAKREEILEVATAVVQERGLDGASMAEIAKRLGGSKATLYGYFPSKDELFVQVGFRLVSKQVSPVLAGLRERAGNDPRDVLLELGNRLMAATTRPEALATLRFAFAQGGVSNLGRTFFDLGPRKGIDACAEYLGAATKAGRLNVPDPVVAAFQLRSLFDAEVRWRLHLGFDTSITAEQIRQVVERAVDTFLAAYGTAAAPARADHRARRPYSE